MIISAQKYKEIIKASAIADAFGYQIEFDSMDSIKSKYGENGLDDFKKDVLASDDTQMSLFVWQAVIYSLEDHNESVFNEKELKTNFLNQNLDILIDWYLTQNKFFEKNNKKVISKIAQNYKSLWVKRAPGNTCLSSLSYYYNKFDKLSDNVIDNVLVDKINDSGGCGAVMRISPLYLFKDYLSLNDIVELSIKSSALTHANASHGYFPSAALIIFLINHENTLIENYNLTKKYLEKYDKKSADKFLDGLNKTITLINEKPNLQFDEITKNLGLGWDGASAFYVALYCAKTSNNFKELLMRSSNHSGDSDSTASIAAQIYCTTNNLDNDEFYQKYENQTDLNDVIEDLFSQQLLIYTKKRKLFFN